MDSFKFRRQQQIGNYIADFVCFEKGLIIELDGGQHAVDMESDKKRDDWLRSEGFEVVRFWNTDVFENIEGVVESIRNRLLTPSLSPSHQGREDGNGRDRSAKGKNPAQDRVVIQVKK